MFTITSEDISPETLRSRVLDPASGGFCAFEGWVRNHHEGKDVTGLSYQSYIPLAETEGTKIIQEALERFEIEKAIAQHRIGDLGIGGLAIYAAVSAAHREPAFTACQYIVDAIKARVPIWKKEHYPDAPSEWVECHHCHSH